jgi:hypothetical protein
VGFFLALQTRRFLPAKPIALAMTRAGGIDQHGREKGKESI